MHPDNNQSSHEKPLQPIMNNQELSQITFDCLRAVQQFQKQGKTFTSKIDSSILLTNLCQIANGDHSQNDKSSIAGLQALITNLQRLHKTKNKPTRRTDVIKLFSDVLHQFIHHSTPKQMPKQVSKICVVFMTFFSEEVLEEKIINYAFFALSLTYEILSKSDIKAIQLCLRYMFSCGAYPKVLRKAFAVICYLTYLGASKQPEDAAIIHEIVLCPYKLSSLLIEFRYEYPKNEILVCRDLSGMSSSLIDSTIVKTLLNIFFCTQHKQIKDNVLVTLKCLIQYDLTIPIVKNLIRKLEIIDMSANTVKEWKEIFNLLKLAANDFENYKDEKSANEYQKDVIVFEKDSYLKWLLENITGIKIRFKSYRFNAQLLLLKLMRDSKQVWVTIRHIFQLTYLITIICFDNKVVYEMKKKQVTWKPFEIQTMKYRVVENLSVFDFGRNDTIEIINIKPTCIIIGNLNGNVNEDIGTYLCELSEFTISYDGEQHDFIQQQRRNSLEPGRMTNNIKLSTKNSLVILLKQMGDLDLFFLVVSHLIRKVDNNDYLLEMLAQVFGLMQSLVKAKRVFKVALKKEQSEKRQCNVSFLSWLASRTHKSGVIVLELLRFLQIRNIDNSIDLLSVLCNFGLWKQIPFLQHRLLTEKIKQLFDNCQPKQHSEEIFYFCKRIVLDLTIFYKNAQVHNEAHQEDYLRKHAQLLNLASGEINKMLKQNQLGVFLSYLKFLMKTMYLLIDKTRQNEHIDTTIGYEIALFIYQLIIAFRETPLGDVKTPLRSPKRKNQRTSQEFENNEKRMPFRILELYEWNKEILYILENQLLIAEDSAIKYYDWNCSTPELISVNEQCIIKTCSMINIALITYNQEIYECAMIERKPFEEESEQLLFYWQINFIETNSTERMIEALEHGPIDQSISNESTILKILEKSFELKEHHKILKIPHQFLLKMKMSNINLLVEFFKQKLCKAQFQLKASALSTRDFEQICQNILYFVATIPGLFYTNTMELRQMMKLKLKRIQKTIEEVQKHLILKQLAHESVKVITVSKSKIKRISSTIGAFTEKEVAEQEHQNGENETKIMDKQEQLEIAEVRGKQIEIRTKKDNQELPQINNISTEQIIDSFEHIKLLATSTQIKRFYNIKSEKLENSEEIAGLVQNFTINMNAILEILEQERMNDKINALQSFVFFLERHIYEFSCMIMNDYIFFNQVLIQKERRIRRPRKKSFKMIKENKKREQSEDMYRSFLEQCRKSMFKIERLWGNVEKNNKYFWELFYNESKKNQSVDPTCNSLKMRGLIKIDNEKREIELPKNILTASKKFSISGDSDDKDLTNEGESENSIFQEATQYQLDDSEADNNEKKQNLCLQKKKQRKDNEFSVIWVTTTSIYQGILLCEKDKLVFQEEVPHDAYYDLLCATEHERRTIYQIEKNPSSFEIELSQSLTIIPKRYLYHEAAVQIYSFKKSYFISFRRNKKRENFLKLYEKMKGRIKDEHEVLWMAKIQMGRWIKGDISNFTYLMHLNDLGSRSFNDMSQYYVFPWTIINFKEPQFTLSFLQDAKNYRNLSLPMGAINEKRFKEIKEKYQESLNYKQQSESFMYGSFYSNPAIVCNYMVRIQPFSMHHYYLQSEKFDIPDRIFYSIQNQFLSCYENHGDYKQLIPEFYFCPEFLRNRSKYNFGQRQNKQIVNNVQLPQWAKQPCEGNLNDAMDSSQQKFIFLMRRGLQSQYVTQNLNKWIDLIFGVYSNKERANERFNLFAPTYYKNQLSRQSKIERKQSKQMCLIFYKEFGQVPRDLFNEQHKANTFFSQNKTGHKQWQNLHESFGQQIFNRQLQGKQCSYCYTANQIYIYFKSELKVFSLESNKAVAKVTFTNPISYLTVVNLSYSNTGEKPLKVLIYLKSGMIAIRETSISTFRKRLQIGEERSFDANMHDNAHFLTVFEEQSLIIVAQNSSIKIYRYVLNRSSSSSDGQGSAGYVVLENKKAYISLFLHSEFTQHRSKIKAIGLIKSYGLIISIDSNRKVYVLQVCCKEVKVMHSFKLKKMTFCQQILQMCIHEMGYLVLLTSMKKVSIHNLMGDNILEIETDKLVKKGLLEKSEEICVFQIWNHETSELIFGTTRGKVIRIDCYIEEDHEVMTPFNSGKRIESLHVSRIGRHWRLQILSDGRLKVVESTNYKQAFKRQEEYSSKYNFQ